MSDHCNIATEQDDEVLIEDGQLSPVSPLSPPMSPEAAFESPLSGMEQGISALEDDDDDDADKPLRRRPPSGVVFKRRSKADDAGGIVLNRELVRRMKDPSTGFERDSKGWFTGEQVITWCMTNINCTPPPTIAQAEAVAHYLFQENIIRCAKGRHRHFVNSNKRLFAFSKDIVIIGGGFAGSTCAKALEDDFRVTLIDTKRYFECNISNAKLTVDPSYVESIRANHDHYLKHARIVIGRVTEVDQKEVTILVNDADYPCDDVDEDYCPDPENPTMHTIRIDYDFLIMCSGSSYDMAYFHSINPDKVPIINCTSSNELLGVYAKAVAAHRLTVIGGGPCGIEVASELMYRYPDKKINLIAKGKLLERCCAAAHKNVIKYLKNFPNIEVIIGDNVIGIEKKGDMVFVNTESGQKIRSDVIYGCIGFSPNTSYMKAHFPDVLNEKGAIKVLPTMQVEGYPHMFALGDITSFKEERLAQIAKLHAEVCISNIKKIVNGQTSNLSEYSPAPRMMLISLGPKKALMVHGERVMMESVIVSKIKDFVEYLTMRKVTLHNSLQVASAAARKSMNGYDGNNAIGKDMSMPTSGSSNNDNNGRDLLPSSLMQAAASNVILVSSDGTATIVGGAQETVSLNKMLLGSHDNRAAVTMQQTPRKVVT